MPVDPESPASVKPLSFREAVWLWWKIGWLSFGGPAGQIALMHKLVVEQKKWISDREFLHGLNFCMLLPGPEAQQLVTYIGWRLDSIRGGIVAGILFVLPGALVLWLLAWLSMVAGETRWVTGVFSGLVPVVIAIVLSALIRIARKSLKHPVLWAVAGLAFVALFGFNIYFPAIIGLAALAGVLVHRAIPVLAASWVGSDHGVVPPEPSDGAASAHAGWFRILIVCLALWAFPIVASGFVFGWDSIFVKLGLFFSKVAVVTFGGAYAVLPFVAQAAVENYAWLSAEQMITGLAMAETTPGPLIMVLQYVGFVAAWADPHGMSPLLAATVAAAITTWVTFVPCFLFVFLGAPWMLKLQHVQWLRVALTFITAAVVGVILNLAVWFSLNAYQGETPEGRIFLVVLAVIFFAALQSGRAGVVPIVLLGAVCGLIRAVVGF